MPQFSGFPKGGMKFWHDLAREMNKEWFDGNKARYQREWVEPMAALLQDVQPRLAREMKPVALGEPKVMRIYRDVRFSKDKTPYKTHIGAAIPLRDRTLAEGGCAALYIHLGLGEQFAGVGMYQFGPETLGAWRSAVGKKAGNDLAREIERLRKKGYRVESPEVYKKVPAGFAENHPQAELLKMKGLTVAFPELSARLIQSPKLPDWLVGHGAESAALLRWVVKHIVA